MKNKTKEIVLISLCSAVLFTAQISLSFIPNVELVTLLIIIFSKYLGKKTIPVIYIFVLLEGTIFGFGYWLIGYLYIWPLLYLASVYVERIGNIKDKIKYSVLALIFGLTFGLLFELSYIPILGLANSFEWWMAGIPYDIAHGLSNLLVVYLLYSPLESSFGKIYENWTY
jgi:energy-coupling factor transport system substrate-specific component